MIGASERMWLFASIVLLLAMASCSVVQSGHSRIGPQYDAWPADHPIEIFCDGVPARRHVRVARLDVHIEKSDFRNPSFEEVLPELLKEARRSGADAIIEIQERKTWVVGSRAYHVTAVGIRYLE